MPDGHHIFCKTIKLSYRRNHSVNFNEIWHGNANWPPTGDRPLEFQSFENPSQLLHLWQATDWYKCGSWLLCLECADKTLIFAVLKQWLLQQRETEASFDYIMFGVVWLSVWSRCRLFAYGPADATASQNPVISGLILIWTGFYFSGTGLPGLSWKRGH